MPGSGRTPPGAVLYRAKAVGPRAWWLCWGLLSAIAVVPALLQPSDEGFLLDLLAYAGAWGIPIWVTLLTLWSVDRYAAITLTRSTLRVGRDRLPVADLDPDGVRAVPREQPSAARRLADSAGQIQVPGTRIDLVSRPGRELRHLGGSWGTPLGMDSVLLPLRDGSAVLVDVRDRAGLLAAIDPLLG